MKISIFSISSLYFFLALIAFSGAAGYGFSKWNIAASQKAAIEENDREAVKIGEALALEGERLKTLAEADFEVQSKRVKTLAEILPPDENYTDLTRSLDAYFEEQDKPGNPILQSSLRFGKGAPVNGILTVSALPVAMNIEASRDNFFKFLEYVNESGTLSRGTRLMDITNIELNLAEGGESLNDPKQKINFSVDMNAYYLTPIVKRGT